jgi:hypothetical protein
MAAQAQTAAYERCYAVGVNPVTNYPWTARVALAFERGKLVNVKSMVNSVYSYYVRPSCFNGGDTIDAYLQTGSVERLWWTNAAEFLRASNAPTNWFNTTPWIALNVHSNGWVHLPGIMSNLVAAAAGNAALDVWGPSALRYTVFDPTNSLGLEASYRGQAYSTQSWVDAVSAASTNWQEVDSDVYDDAYAYWEGFSYTNYPGDPDPLTQHWFARLTRKTFEVLVPTNRVTCTRQVYVFASTNWVPGGWGGVPPYFETWNNQGDNITTNYGMMYEIASATHSTNLSVGDLSRTEPPYYYETPPVENYGDQTNHAWGWGMYRAAYDPVIVWKFNVAGGFKF